VLDIDEATQRWALQFGLTVVAREPGRALLRADAEDYCLELVEDRAADHDHTAWELAADCTPDEAAAEMIEMSLDPVWKSRRCSMLSLSTGVVPV
jgi:hypothetical protein